MVEILDGEAVIGRAMPAGEKPLDHLAGDQLQVPKPGQTVGIEELGHGRLDPSLDESVSVVIFKSDTPRTSLELHKNLVSRVVTVNASAVNSEG